MAALTSSGIFATFILRFNISGIGAVLVQPQSDFHLTKLQLGLIFTAFLVPYTVLQPIAGWATDRFGAKLTLLVGTLAASIITITTGFVSSFFALISLRAILGLTQAPNFVSGAKVSSSDWYDHGQRAKSASTWIAGGRLGTAITIPLATTLAVVYGWRWGFYITGLIGLLWCVAWLVVFREEPTIARIHKAHDQESTQSGIRTAMPVIASSLGLGLVLASFGQGYLAYLLGNWLPTYLGAEGFTVVNAGLLSFLPIIAAVLTIILIGGLLSDHLAVSRGSLVSLRSGLFALGMLGASGMLVLTAYASQIAQQLHVSGGYFALFSLTIAGAMWGMATPSLWVALIEAVPKESVGAVGGVQNLGGNAGGIAVSLLTGYFVGTTNTFFLAILLTCGMTMTAAVSALVLIKPRRQDLKLLGPILSGTALENP
ncbi:MAG TPA: MFS transporter [Candidatus Bathyarchaeia archaeon]|nr:MFS transporter [Candidatus Bathyarchaeia archaeon]